MRVLLATNHLGLGGSESYLLTVAEQLDRLGHDSVIYTPEPEGGVDVARERGIAVEGEAALEDEYDAALVQDTGVSLQVADRCPQLHQLYVAHSTEFDLQAPPQLDGVVGLVVALNDRVAKRMRRYATAVEVVRLRQPIDTARFAPRGTLPAVPRKVLLLSNTPHADRLEMLETACTDAGLELLRLGGLAGRAVDVRPSLAEADIVIGYGRSILEAMAFGRAAYVFDWKGGDGWVTAESYPAIEANGIAGGASDKIVDRDRLAEDLRRYSPSMGPVNHDLVVTHHRANVHAQELVHLFERLAQPAPRPRAPLQEMARLVRLEWRARLEISGLANENTHLRDLLAESRQHAEDANRRAEDATRRADDADRRVHELTLAFQSSISWRLTKPLRALARLGAGLAKWVRQGRERRMG
jgi:hypothetical protein